MSVYNTLAPVVLEPASQAFDKLPVQERWLTVPTIDSAPPESVHKVPPAQIRTLLNWCNEHTGRGALSAAQ